ncbi:MAG: zinc-dependent metalloprotease [Chitinophagaceae bacterium]|nr:zinc-dependent metalloprotease [Chitinophagaceae bacterium]MCB0739580.1 zinc-dependent metalloprotease [Chitinophagaceae bacterium]HQV06165.1 zinc-dependent metalloprotease [Chitinophagaceae bacterium]
MQLNFRSISLFIVSCFGLTLSSIAQPTKSNPQMGKPSPTMKKKSTNGIKQYGEVITDEATTYNGFFNVHKVDDKYYFEIPDDLFGRDILIVNRIAKAGADMRSGGSMFGFGGDPIGQNVVRFEKGPDDKIFLRKISFSEYAKDSTSPMFQAVRNSNIQPIEASFSIESLGKDSTGVVIDMTKELEGDDDIFFFNSGFKTALRLTAMQRDKSYIESVKAFPINIEIKTVKTYARSAPRSNSRFGGNGQGNLTMELNSSMVLLPEVPMQSRYADDRIGYFSVGYVDFDANPQGVKSVRLIKRWRLEPKPEDVEKYKRGELVEPQKQIVFYIDPATPEKWIPYLIQGVKDWNVAFEQAGFKNAITAKRAPTFEEDSTWSLDDARNSAIVYKASEVPNASGPSIADPRSGEIIESHINWYHNVMQLLHDWYFVQAGAVDTTARKMIFSDSLMGELIRFASSHEVGHTLGLLHNFGSSSTVPVENLRNKAWLDEHGHTPSIMDYARFNYVAQPEDSVDQKDLFPRIGEYDKWAIEWGYKRFAQYRDPEQEIGFLNKWVIQKLKNHRLWYGSASSYDDPRCQSEQVGDDAMKGSMYGIKNLKRILPNLMVWTKEPNEDYDNLQRMYQKVAEQLAIYMGHVSRYVGGIMETPRRVEESEPVFEIVDKAKQREAVNFLNKNLFDTPEWLIRQDIYDRTGQNGLSIIGAIQDRSLRSLLSKRTFYKLINAEATEGTKAYRSVDLLNDLKKGIMSELPGRKTIDVYRRNLQKSFVDKLCDIINPPEAASNANNNNANRSEDEKTDMISAVRGFLTSLRTEIKYAAAASKDLMTKYHLQDLYSRIGDALDGKK